MSYIEKEVHTFLMNFVITGVTSSVIKTLVAPLDRIKLILQNQSSATHIVTGQRRQYVGLIDCIKRIPIEQGVLSFWRGNGANLLRYIPAQALNFSFHDFLKSTFCYVLGDTVISHDLYITYLSGGCAGACSVLAIYPLKFCQTHLSVDMGTQTSNTSQVIKREFNGLTDCATKIINKEGALGLYRGFPLALLGSSIYRSLYFGMFETFKHLYNKSHQDESKIPFLLELLFAQTVTTVAGLVTYPLDTAGRRLMLECGQPKQYMLLENSWKAFGRLLAKEGFSSFYKGALTNCLKGTCGAIILVSYEEFSYYTKWKQNL